MKDLGTIQLNLDGLKQGSGPSTFVEPSALSKGKLCAAATRDKFHDSADLRILLSRHGDEIKGRASELNLKYVGLAVRRYSILETMFQNLGIDVNHAKKLAGELKSEDSYPQGPGQVQYALLGNFQSSRYQLGQSA